MCVAAPCWYTAVMSGKHSNPFDPEDFREPDPEPDPPDDPVHRKGPKCVRCGIEKTYCGTKSFHEGSRWGILGDLGELFVNKETFDIYVCRQCGSVEFFLDGVGEDLRPE